MSLSDFLGHLNRHFRCIVQALYSRATGAAKGVAGLAFMMWMSGNQIHLFSIMMTFQGIYAPIAAILGSGEGDFVLQLVKFHQAILM